MAENDTPTINDTLVQEEAPTATETGPQSTQSKVGNATDRIREEAGKLGSQAAEAARNYAGEGKDRATSALDSAADMLRNAALDVDSKLGENYGQYARSAADGIAGFAESLRGKQVDDLIDDATAFVKKSPVIAIGTAAAVGFVLARLIKSGVDAAADLADTNDNKSGKA